MKEILEKKKKEKRVVKYVLRKYTVGVVSVAISVSLISPAASALAVSIQGNEGEAVISQDITNEDNILEDSLMQPIEDESEDKAEVIKDVEEKNVENVEETMEDPLEAAEVVEPIVINEDFTAMTKEALISEEKARELVKSVIGNFKSIQYEDLYDILGANESSLDRFNIINKLKASGIEPSEAEIKKAMRTLYMNRLDLETSFNNVKANLEKELVKIITHSTYAEESYLNKYNKRILLALTYLEKQYSFSFGSESAKDLILYNCGFQQTSNKVLDDVIALGTVSYADLQLKRNLNTYDERIAPITGISNLLDFIQKGVETYTSYSSAEEWFKATSKAWIVEGESKIGETSIYKKMINDSRLKSHIIPLLVVSEDSLYAISTMSTVTYGSIDTYLDKKSDDTKRELKETLKQTAKKQELFLDFWYRISKVNNKLLEGQNIIITDSLLKYGDTGTAESRWSPETGQDALSAVREFIAPLGLYTQFMFADGQAGTDNSVNLFLSKSLTDRGQETYTHEVTHLLDNKVWLNGYGRRTGKGAEAFARGLFESVNNNGGSLLTEPIFNLNLSYELGEERIQNQSPERFQSESDLKQYMQGLMDVIYTLDYIEAKSSLSKTAEEKAILYNELELTPDSKKANVVNDTFKHISEETAAGLNTIDDLIDKNIVSGRLAFQGILTTGTAEDNGYYVVPLFNPIYAAMQNNSGAVGDISFKRNAYELLAQYGYSDGMAAYISDKYANDEEALKGILDSKYNGNLSAFKKDMFSIRAGRLSYLKGTDVFTDYEDLQAKMDKAVEEDLAVMKLNKKYGISNINQNVGAVNKLKMQILQSYLKSTDDFRTSIYEDIKVGEEEEVSQEIIPSAIINKSDDTLWEDESRIEKGTDGIQNVIKVWRTENGIKVGVPEVKIEVIQEMTSTVVYKGTKKIKGEIVTVDDNVVIPVEIIEKENPDLYIGETETILGEEGIKKVTTVQETEKDKPVGEAVVTEEIIKDMIPTIVYIGTKTMPNEEDTSIPDKDNTIKDDTANGSGNTNDVNNGNNTTINNNSNGNSNTANNIIISNNDNSTENSTINIVENNEVSQSDLLISETLDSSNNIVEEEKRDVKEEINKESLETEESNSKFSKEKKRKESNKMPIAVASVLGVSALIAVGVKSVFGTKLLTILKTLFKFK